MESNLISVVVPVHDEAENIPSLVTKIEQALLKVVQTFEIIFVDDGSSDDSLGIIKALAESNKNIKYVGLTRNFGKERAMTAGLRRSKGQAAIMMDADHQHPPRLLPEFIKLWQEGAEVVIGLRKGSEKNGAFRGLASKTFNNGLSRFSHQAIIPYATDFRLLDRKVIDEFNQFTERNRLTRGLIDWLGFKYSFIEFKAEPRLKGSSLSKRKLMQLAVHSYVSHSLFPLKVAGYLGAFMTLLAGIFGVFIIIERYILSDPYNLHFSGPAILATILVFMVGIVLVSLGLVALYVANIHDEVINRPLYVVREESE